ncbi:unnamed protein product [Trichobilharzia szidati]|nr:unnamed protein product [Trichobilharzia szidati]
MTLPSFYSASPSLLAGRRPRNTEKVGLGGGTAGSIIVRKLWDGFQRHQCKSFHQAASSAPPATVCMRQTLFSNNDNQTCRPLCYTYRPKILLLESGPRMSWLTKIISDTPLFAPLLYGRGIDTVDQTTSQKSAALQLKNNVIFLPSGRVLGGTAVLNAMIFSCGHPDDELVKQFLKNDPEFFSTLFDGKSEGCHLKPEVINHQPYNRLIHEYFEKAFSLRGSKVDSFGAACQSHEGLHIPMGFVRNAQRISSFSECLLPLMNEKPNDLTVITGVQVEKLLFTRSDHGNLSAYGVLAKYKGHSFTIKLKNTPQGKKTRWNPEIILSAGAIKTPEILLSSGVGPVEDYSNDKKPNLLNLPVGKNLHDHPMIGLICSVVNGKTLTMDSFTLAEMFKYYWRGEGILSQASAVTSIGYYRTSYQKAENDSRPDIQYTIISASPFEKDTFENLGNFQPSAWDKFSKDENGENFESPIILLVTLINPRSRGELKMQNSAKNNNNNKGDNCESGRLDINPAYFSEQSDLDRLIEGIIWIHQTLYYINEVNQLTRSTVTTSEKPISIKLHLPRYSGCPQIPKANSSRDFESIEFSKNLKAAVTCLAKSITLSNYHLVGTCSMKLPNAKFSPVVEDNFKLIGVNNVRIGDASVISKIPSGNPASLIMAIGNQLAKYVIYEGWQ